LDLLVSSSSSSSSCSSSTFHHISKVSEEQTKKAKTFVKLQGGAAISGQMFNHKIY
jgi:hypothetical protein